MWVACYYSDNTQKKNIFAGVNLSLWLWYLNFSIKFIPCRQTVLITYIYQNYNIFIEYNLQYYTADCQEKIHMILTLI